MADENQRYQTAGAPTMKKQTIAILSVSAGAGHVRAAEALRTTVQKDYPDCEAVHIDVMSFVSQLFRKFYAESYLSIVEHHPALWGYLYRKADTQKEDRTLKSFRLAIERLNTRSFMTHLKKINPDKIICTHFLPAELLDRQIRHNKFNRPVWVQVTDFDVHAMWVQKQMTGYFAASAEVACRMADRGIPAEKIQVTGIPVMPAFSEKLSREECLAEIGLDPRKRTLLMMSGGYGIGGIDIMARRLLTLQGDFQIIALSGKNEELLHNLESLAIKHPGRLFPMGFTTTIERIMAAADFAVTKPGGLTSSECLAMGLPMIVISPIPGQEERNADYLMENGAALKAYDGAGLVYKAEMLLNNPQQLARMRKRALAIGRPDAARKVLDIVLNP